MSSTTLRHTGRLRKMKRAACFYMLTSFWMLLSNMSFAYAETKWDWDATAFNAEWLPKINEVYSFLRSIALPLAAVLIAGCFLAMLFGSQKDMEKMVGRIKIILIAMVCLYLLPLVVTWGKGLLSDSGIAGLPAPTNMPSASPAPTG